MSMICLGLQWEYRMRKWVAFGLPTLLFSAAVLAQTSPPAAVEEEAEITVVGMSTPQRATFEQFREAQQAFRKWQPKLGPSAKLEFEINSKGTVSDRLTDLSSVRLALLSDNQRIEIPINANHRFTLPDLTPLRGKFKIVANVGKRPIAVSPEIYSPGTSLEDRRLGDLRLECQTGWAFMKSETSFFVRGMFNAAGGCQSKRIGFYFGQPKAIERVSVTDRGKTSPVPVSTRSPNSYRPPIFDKNLSNEARIQIIFR
jgi:hypothetical protein